MIKKLFKSFIIVITIILICIVVNSVSIWCYGYVDEKQQADVIVVLGAGSYNDKLSPVFIARIDHSIELYKDGYASKIIFTGGKGEGNQSTDAHAAYVYAVENGVDKDDIILEDESTLTLENIINSKAIMDEYEMDDAIIVSDPLHMKRAMLMCKMYDLKAYSSPTPTSKYKSLNTKIPFLVKEVFYYIGYKFYFIYSSFIQMF